MGTVWNESKITTPVSLPESGISRTHTGRAAFFKNDVPPTYRIGNQSGNGILIYCKNAHIVYTRIDRPGIGLF